VPLASGRASKSYLYFTVPAPDLKNKKDESRKARPPIAGSSFYAALPAAILCVEAGNRIAPYAPFRTAVNTTNFVQFQRSHPGVRTPPETACLPAFPA